MLKLSQAATETVFENICPFYNFPGGSICSSNRHEFSRKVHLFVEQTLIFQEGLYVLRTDTNFPGGSICSSNRY